MVPTETPPIWVINLKRSVDRRNFIHAQLNMLGLQHEIVEAVDGRLLTSEETSALYSPAEAIELLGRELTPGEIGCSLSHLRLYQRQVDEGHEEVLILEDDVVIDPSFIDVLRDRDRLPSDWELVLFHRLNTPLISYWGSRPFGAGRCVKFASLVDGTQSYLLRLSAARKLLKSGYPVRMPADSLTGGMIKTGVNLYAVDPPCIRQFSSQPEQSTMPENYPLHGFRWRSAGPPRGYQWLRLMTLRTIRKFDRSAIT